MWDLMYKLLLTIIIVIIITLIIIIIIIEFILYINITLQYLRLLKKKKTNYKL